MKTIELTKNEKIWILLCKGWIMKKYPIKDKEYKSFMDYIQPYFDEVYGWSAKEFEQDFQRCIFNALFDIFMKIREGCQNNSDIKEIILTGCFKCLWNDDKNALLRIIRKIRSEIAIASVMDNDGTARFDLSTEMGLFINDTIK
jgi:YesN/AraC family two-component response regulator